MESIKIFLLIILTFSTVKVFSTANPTRPIVNLSGDPYTDFASDEYLGGFQNLEVWITWNSSTLWVAWRGGSTNQLSDKYYFAIDVDPGTSNGTTNVYGGLQWIGLTQNGLNKPDYVYHWDNISEPTEYLATGDSFSGWSTATVDFTDFIVGGAPGVVEAGIPWANLGGSFPSSFSFWFWTNNSGESTVWSAFPNDIPTGNGIQTVNSKYFVANTSGNVSPNTLVASPLPVELSAFSAVVLENAVKLEWRTETEVSNYGFEIERLQSYKIARLQNWQKIGFVEGHGNSNSPKDYSFVDDNVTAGEHSYRLKQIDTDGKFEYSKVIEINLDSSQRFELSQNYPNPFNPVTTIRYTLPQPGNVKLNLYSTLGELVAVLVNGYKEAGIHTINFNGENLQSGLYIYRMETSGFVQSGKMILLK